MLINSAGGGGEALDTDPFSSCMVRPLDLAFGRERQRLDQRKKKQSGDKRQRQSRKVEAGDPKLKPMCQTGLLLLSIGLIYDAQSVSHLLLT